MGTVKDLTFTPVMGLPFLGVGEMIMHTHQLGRKGGMRMRIPVVTSTMLVF